jgi:(p)ppGpp synthase/HD superfamily hydrolase
MTSYATTYPQLINQAIALDRPPSDLAALRATYEFAEPLCDGIYRAQGVPIINHFVRAASIVLAADAPIEVVQVAMLHGAYRLSYFRDSRRRRLRASHRRLVRRRLGEQVEALLHVYHCLNWYDLESVEAHLTRLGTHDQATLHALLVRLADYLDDHLDGAMAYAGRVADDPGARAFSEACQGLARRLGAPRLGAEIAAAYQVNCSVELPDVVVMHRGRGYERPRRHLWEKTWVESTVVDMARRAYRRLRRRGLASAQTYGESRVTAASMQGPPPGSKGT